MNGSVLAQARARTGHRRVLQLDQNSAFANTIDGSNYLLTGLQESLFVAIGISGRNLSADEQADL